MCRSLWMSGVWGVFWVGSISILFGGEPSGELFQDEEVETIDVFQVPGTPIEKHTPVVSKAFPVLEEVFPLHPVGVGLTSESRDEFQMVRRREVLRDPVGAERNLFKPSRLEQGLPPVYPRFARLQGWEGTVIVRVHVGVHGKVTKSRVQKSSGHEALDEAALKGVLQWHFHPAKDGEIPIVSIVDVPIRFALTDTP